MQRPTEHAPIGRGLSYSLHGRLAVPWVGVRQVRALFNFAAGLVDKQETTAMKKHPIPVEEKYSQIQKPVVAPDDFGTRLAAQMKPEFVVRHSDGAIDIIRTTLNQLRSGQPLESDNVLKQISADEYIGRLEEYIKALHLAWNEESERVSSYKAYSYILWMIILILLGAIIIIKISQ